MESIRFSIITPCLNAQAYISEAIESVLAQNIAAVEHIIVDGCSTDDTLKILKNYPHLTIISEPDKGMYDAINKGIHLARGEWIGLLNADDIYPDGSLKQALETLDQTPHLQAVNGGFAVFEDDGQGRKIIRVSPSIAPGEFWYRIIAGSTAPNTWFIKNSVFREFGLYDDRYRYAADREMIMRLALAGIRPLSLPGVNYWFRQHKQSATFSMDDSRDPKRGALRMKILLEGNDIQERFLSKPKLPQEVKNILRQAHSETCYRLAMTAIYHRQPRNSILAIFQGFRYDIFWPMVFARMAAHRVLKEVAGHG
jgi:glycosyltransferase involved in cell wall biosynthesis